METAVVITLHTIFSRHLMVVVSNAHLYIYVTRQIALGVRHVLIFLLLLFDCLMWKYSEKKEVVVSYSNCLNPLLALCDTKATATIHGENSLMFVVSLCKGRRVLLYFEFTSFYCCAFHHIENALHFKCQSIRLNIPSKS